MLADTLLISFCLQSGFADACEVLAQGDVLWVAKWSGEKQLHDDVLLSWVTAVLRWLQSLDDDKLQVEAISVDYLPSSF